MPTFNVNWVALSIFLFSSLCLLLFFVLLPTQFKANGKYKTSGSPALRAQILVLGDVGRSPRMQYHALSISKHGGTVDLIGYTDSEIHPRAASRPSIAIHSLKKTPGFLKTGNRWLFFVYGPLKVLFQVIDLWIVLAYRIEPAAVLIIQNPPSIPTLLIAQLACLLRDTKLVIDWHNFGYTILALKLGDGHPLVYLSRWYERVFSCSADVHFTVTQAMARILKNNFRITKPILTLHDRPSADFQPMDSQQRLAFLGQLPETAPFIDEILQGKLKVLVSSTSWTPDEDFTILLEALVDYSYLATTSHPHLPELLVIITGKGPQKDLYLQIIDDLKSQDKLEMAIVKTAWLSTANYASLLGSADVGISLHTSSSGVDLPMKVVDMFGAGLPVVGWGKFEAWPELVKEGINGRGFGSSDDLKNILVELFGGDDRQLQDLRMGAVEESERGWDDEWDRVAGRLLGLC